MMDDTARLIDYWRNKPVHPSGSMLYTPGGIIMYANHAWLEHTHDYIQWVYPLPTKSAFNPDVPILTEEAIAAMKASPAIMARRQLITRKMRDFFANTTEWRRVRDHNHLRITRILKSLMLIEGRQEALIFHASILTWLGPDGLAIMPRRTLDFWRECFFEVGFDALHE
jgi:hypothetical protein